MFSSENLRPEVLKRAALPRVLPETSAAPTRTRLALARPLFAPPSAAARPDLPAAVAWSSPVARPAVRPPPCSVPPCKQVRHVQVAKAETQAGILRDR